MKPNEPPSPAPDTDKKENLPTITINAQVTLRSATYKRGTQILKALMMAGIAPDELTRAALLLVASDHKGTWRVEDKESTVESFTATTPLGHA